MQCDGEYAMLSSVPRTTGSSTIVTSLWKFQQDGAVSRKVLESGGGH
jgi:hypothetical protein